MNKIKFHVVENKLYYKGNVVLEYSIEYPEILKSDYEQGKQDFNIENKKIAFEYKEYAETMLYQQAILDKNLKFFVTNKVIFNEDNKICIAQEEKIIKDYSLYITNKIQNWDLKHEVLDDKLIL